MLAAASGHSAAVEQLLANQADSNAKENANGQTALMFAAASDRRDVVKLLLELGADVALDVEGDGHLVAGVARGSAAGRDSPGDAAHADQCRRQVRRADAHGAASAGQAAKDIPGVTRPYNYNELIGKQGGLSALHFAARQGSMATVKALLDGRRRRQPARAPATAPRRCWWRPSTATSISPCSCSTRAPTRTWPARPA